MKPLVKLLAFSSLFFAMLLPPEAYSNGKLAVVLSATFAFFAALSERKIPNRFIQAGVCIFGLLFLHTMTLSIDLYRSLDTLSLIWAYYCLIGFFVYAGHGLETDLAAAMVVLSLIVSGYGLYQYFWGFDKIQQFIFNAASDQIVKAPALGVIALRRVSSTLALPGTLWGFLVCALPFHGMLWGRRRWLNVVVAISAVMVFSAGFLTRSFGFLLGLSVLAIVAILLRYRRMAWNRFTPVLVLVLVLAGVFYSSRRGAIEGSDPAGLRFKNWVSAWNIFEVHPWGTGLNTFGIIYPEYMQPGANETQFVHNTPLQLLSELGLPLLLGVAILLVAKAPSIAKIRIQRPEAFWLALALAVWITHNFIDIDVYFGSVGALGAVIIGMLFARKTPPQDATASLVERGSIALVSVFAVLVIVFAAIACISTELQYRAQIEYDNKKLTTAVETLRTARQICPINSSLYHDAGEILLNLYQARQDPQYQEEALQAFKTEVELSPKKAGAHTGYALSLSTEGRMPEALQQIRTAQSLYPSSSYIYAITLLMEKNVRKN